VLICYHNVKILVKWCRAYFNWFISAFFPECFHGNHSSSISVIMKTSFSNYNLSFQLHIHSCIQSFIQ